MADDTIYHVSEWLLIIGGFNWLLAVFNFNLVKALLGTIPLLENAVYVLVGLSAVYLAYHKLKK